MSFSISEIMVVLVVALVVIKPEQLPDVAYKLGKWAKQVRSTMHKLRREIDGTSSQLNEQLSLDAPPEKTANSHDARKS